MTAGGPVPDVAIIGGGIVGAATAAFLAANGAAVTLWEGSAIAAAASGRNSGVVQHPFDPVLVALYRETLSLYRTLAPSAPADASFRIAAEPSGLLLIGAGEDGAASVARLAQAWAAAYPEAAPEVIGDGRLRSLEPSLADGLVACRLSIGYPVGPAAATRAFAAVAAARGAEIAVGRAARPAIREGRVVGVEADGTIRPAGAVVVAAGPWTPGLVGAAFAVPITRVWGVVAGIELADPPRHVLEEVAIDIEPTRPGTASVQDDATIGFSLVTADRASALGSTFLDDEPDPAAFVERLRARGERYVPRILDAPVAGLRVCARPMSTDRRPLVGAVPGVTGLFVAAGHGPWGISTGPATARMMADLVLGRPAGIPPELAPSRFGA